MIDVKKLIAGFLILAAATASLALFFSYVGGSQPAAGAIPGNAFTAQIGQGSNAAQDPSSAFLPSADLGTVSTDASALSGPVISDPNNLTDVLADSFANTVSAANQGGLTTDDSGNPTLTAPDQQALVDQIGNSTAIKNFKAPNWDLDAAQQKINVIQDSTQDAVVAYASALSDAYSKYYVKTGVEGLLGSGANDPLLDPSTLSSVAPSFSDGLAATAGIKTPAPLADFQRSLVKVLVYQKKAIDISAEANTDPVKASLTIQSENLKYNMALSDLQGELDKAVSANVFPPSQENKMVAFMNSFLGIETAHAQFVVTDPHLTLLTFTNHQIDFSQHLWEQLQNVLLQILKNTLISFIQKRALQWVTGSSQPRFIQQWEANAINVGISAANNAIDSHMACIPPELQKSVVTTLKISYNSKNPRSAAACPTPPIQIALGGNTLKSFASDFTKGGWSAYGATLLPSGNFYGNVFVNAQIAGQSLNVAVTQAANKSVAGQGFTGDKRCADGSDPVNGTHPACQDQSVPGSTPISLTGGAGTGTSCAGFGPEYALVQAPNGGRCASGDEPTVTTPDQTTNQGLSHGFDSNIKLIVSANNIVGILVAMVNSLFNSLMQAAIGSVTGAINAGLSSAGSNPGAGGQTGTIGGTVASSSPPQPPLTCTPTTEPIDMVLASTTQATASFGATGGVPDSFGSPPTYTWTAIGGGANPSAGVGAQFNPTYSVFIRGFYTFSVQVAASTGGTATCQVQITAR